MQQVRKLLKACRSLNRTSNTIIVPILDLMSYAIMFFCLGFIGLHILGRGEALARIEYSISYLGILVILSVLRGIYTVFIEDRRRGTKNSLRALTIHLPISEKDFIVAQYLEKLLLFMPVFLTIFALGLFNYVYQLDFTYQFKLGMMILGISVTYILLLLETGLLNYYYWDPRAREISYLILVCIWMGINYIVKIEANRLDTWILNNRTQFGVQYIYRIGSIGGIFLVAIVVGVSYLLYIKILSMLERSK